MFHTQGVNPHLTMGSIYKGALLFMLPIIILLGFLIAFPDVALLLPRMMD